MLLESTTTEVAAAAPPAPLSIVTSAPGAPDVQNLARECVDVSAGDVNKAATMLLRRLRTEYPAYWTDLTNQMMIDWAKEKLRFAAKADRENISASESRAGVSAQSMANLGKTWLMWPVKPGLEMRNAKRSDLLAAGDDNLKKSRTLQARGEWYLAIANKMPNDEVEVGTLMSDGQLASLAKKHKVTE